MIPLAPFFSIVIPAYNRSTLIEAALESVLLQSVTDYELIVVDDGSTDDTVAVATRFARKFSQPVKILTQPNAGPGAARNTGIANATGEYVAFLDSDDVWFPWTLSHLQNAIVQNEKPSFVCGVPVDVRPGQPVHVDGTLPMTIENYADFYSVDGNPFYRFTTSGVAVKRTSLEQVNRMATEGFEDLDLWMRLGIQPGFLLITSPPIVVRRLFGNNLSETRKYNQSGVNLLINSEKSGKYPGGDIRKKDRRRLLTTLMRAASFQMAGAGNWQTASWVYFQILLWSLAQLRFRYLLGLPVRLFFGLFKRS